MSAPADRGEEPQPRAGGSTLWRVEVTPAADAQPWGEEVCRLHDWTCIWCSMSPPICGSCRPVTPPCPANGGIHTCACDARSHATGVG